MEPTSIRYEADTPEEMRASLKKAEDDFKRLVQEGYKCVRIVISDHPHSEGIWVEAADIFGNLCDEDTVYKSNEQEVSA